MESLKRNVAFGRFGFTEPKGTYERLQETVLDGQIHLIACGPIRVQWTTFKM